MCPLLTEDELYAFIVPSPKQRDLLRDGRYAMHSFPCEQNEDAFYLKGTARRIDDAGIRARLADQFVSERAPLAVPPPAPDEIVFAFEIERSLLTRTAGHRESHDPLGLALFCDVDGSSAAVPSYLQDVGRRTPRLARTRAYWLLRA